MNFREIAEAYDLTSAAGEVSIEFLREVAKLVAESGEPIAVTVRKANAKRRAMLDDFGRALEHTRWLT